MTQMELFLAILLLAALAILSILGWKYLALRQRLAESESARRAQEIQLQKDGGLLRAISRATTDGFILVNSDMRVEFVNDAARALLSLENEVGSPLREIAGGSDLQPLVDQSLRQQLESVAQILIRGERAFSAHVQNVGAGTKNTVLIRLQEITELQRLGRARRDFVANISHELRTPVTSLQLLLDTITEETLSDKTFALDLLGKIRLQVDLLRQLTDELMDLALIESGQAPIKLVETRAEDLVHEAIAPLHPQAELKGVHVSVSIVPATIVLADPQAIRKVLGNLIHNAIKFTNSGGRVEVRVQRDGDNVQISVSDTGIGIPANDLPRVFERFYKVDRARARGAGELHGTGLGLAIAKHIVSAHGGKLWADSVEGKGSTFFFTLPVAN